MVANNGRHGKERDPKCNHNNRLYYRRINIEQIWEPPIYSLFIYFRFVFCFFQLVRLITI